MQVKRGGGSSQEDEPGACQHESGKRSLLTIGLTVGDLQYHLITTLLLQEEIIHEAQTMKSYNHPNVLPLFTSFVHGQDLWMVTPFMAGGSVLHIMKYQYPEVRAGALQAVAHRSCIYIAVTAVELAQRHRRFPVLLHYLRGCFAALFRGNCRHR